MPAKTRISDRTWVWLCVALGSVLRLVNITRSSVWYDEAFTMMLIDGRNLAEIWVRNIRDVHPPLHYLVLDLWVSVFGVSELSARSLSAVFMIACIPLAYLLVKRLASVQAARLAALFVAVGPYMIRFAQEARMYAMLTFFVLLATFLLVRALQDHQKRDWVFYALAMAAALYTHYYTVFVAIVHWVYLLKVSSLPKRAWLKPWRLVVVNKHWFLAMIGMSVLFLPWLPSALEQFSRVQAGFWIGGPPPDTVARTLIQFLTFDSLDYPPAQTFNVGSVKVNPVSAAWHLAAYAIFLGTIWHHMRSRAQERTGTFLLAAYALLPSAIVFLLSLRRAIYLDRYFTFAAVGFYCLLAILIAARGQALRWLLSAAVVASSAWGLVNIHQTNNHRMRDVAEAIRSDYTAGDIIVSAEMYSFFDLHYYIKQRFDLGTEPRLLNTETIDTYGVSSLIYDRLDELHVQRYEDLKPPSGFVWVVAQETRQDFFTEVPGNWEPVGQHYHYGRLDAQKYRVR